MSEKAGPILRSTLRALPVVSMLIALGSVPPVAYAQKCAEANDWSAEIVAQTVCGCTLKEATNIAAALAKGLCAMDPDAVNCAAPLTCAAESHTICETIVTGGVGVGPCMPVPNGTPGCPANCPPNVQPVQCNVPAQTLNCDCMCKPNRCNEAHWNVTRTVNLGCVQNTEAAKRAAAKAAFLTECGNADDMVPCNTRECPDPPPPPNCVPDVDTSRINIPCVNDPACRPGEVLCTATGSARCTCRCQ